MDKPSKAITRASALKNLLVKLLEAAGLSIVSFCVFMFLAKVFSPNPGEDKMKFILPKSSKKPSFNLSEHWAGHLPESAQEILDIFNFPEVYSSFGSQLPRGVLLHGLPGTGKTHFARMIAEITDAQFFYASASQFDEMFVGKGAQRVRNLFESATTATQSTLMERLIYAYKGLKPPSKKAVIFIDELDAIGSRSQTMMGQSSTHSTVSQLLTCMDGLGGRGNIFVIAATNNISQIDGALRRSGRFDRVIVMTLPDEQSRLALIKFYLGTSPGREKLEENGILKLYAERTNGFSAADLKNFCNEATMRAIKATIELKKTKGQDSNTAVDPEACTITEENLKSAFAEVYRKVKGERVLPTAEKTRSTTKKEYNYFEFEKTNDDGLDLD